jgi:two-component system cell cycle response regulator DivK
MKEGSDILIVDDDSRNIFALAAVLRSRGYGVQAASSAAEAFALLEGGSDILVVLMDMMMPGMDGYEAIRLLRQTPAWQKLPVVAVTAQAMTGDREKTLEAGADAYLSKPVDVDRLLKLIEGFKERQA